MQLSWDPTATKFPFGENFIAEIHSFACLKTLVVFKLESHKRRVPSLKPTKNPSSWGVVATARAFAESK